MIADVYRLTGDFGGPGDCTSKCIPFMIKGKPVKSIYGSPPGRVVFSLAHAALENRELFKAILKGEGDGPIASQFRELWLKHSGYVPRRPGCHHNAAQPCVNLAHCKEKIDMGYREFDCEFRYLIESILFTNKEDEE